jgi:thiol-disulfide isomerase/thioredoxin
MTAGLIVCAAALVVATAGGLTWRQRNGRMRPVAAGRASNGSANGANANLIGATAVEAAAGNATAGSATASSAAGAQGAAGEAAAGPRRGRRAATAGMELTGAELGGPLGPRATLLQFSSAFCAPCRATRRVLAEVAGMTDGVAHLEIDAESHLELVRRLDVRRTPTVFVLGPDGRIAHRASGQPRKADVIAALGEVT